MANNPFDQRIINQLERPTSSDLNIAQGQINANVRAFARQLLQFSQSNWATGTGPSGALGNSFIIRAAATPSLTEVTMTRGVGFASYAPSIENIDGITGLSTNLDYPVIYSQDRVLDLSLAANPATGTCRRDVIAIRAIGQSEQGLTDSGDTDIYEPSLEAFQAQARFKTLTADLTGQNLTVLDNTQPTTQPIVCIKGAEVAYSGTDSFLSAPATTAGIFGYNNIAIINRYAGQTAITESDIVDYRLVASPGGQLTITGSATVGATSSTTPGAALSNVVIKAPPGIKASIYKLGADSATETNTYALIVAGPRGIASANMTCTLGLPGGSVTDTLFPSQVVLGTQSRNLSADAATVTLLANAAKSSPVQTVAVGQPYHVFPFTVGTVENVVQSVTVPVTITGGGSIIIPEPGESYPADTYAITNHSNYLTFYLNAEQDPALPTSALTIPTYRLSTSLEPLPESVIQWEDLTAGTSYSRVVGFVADVQVLKWEKGVWRLAMAAVGLPTSTPIGSVSPILAQVQVYTYNGSSNPELGPLVADSNEVLLSNRVLNVPEYADFFIDDFEPGAISSNRLYIVIRLKKTRADLAGYAQLYFNSSNDKLAIMQTNILADPPELELKTPPPATIWPAATYPVTGTAGTVTLSIPTGQPLFNPEVTRFGTSGVSNLRTIPVNFTVTLNRS